MSDNVYPVPADIAANALIDDAKYKAMYEQSVKDPNGFWATFRPRARYLGRTRTPGLRLV